MGCTPVQTTRQGGDAVTDRLRLQTEANQIIRSGAPGQDWTGLRKRLIPGLKGQKQFGLARQLIAVIIASAQWPEHARWLHQQQALCTYKDDDLAAADRLAEALRILPGPGRTLEEPGWDAETLSLGGAIHKRYWDFSGQRHHLETALRLYSRAVTAGRKAESIGDWTYAAINAAFTADLLAVDMAGAGMSPTLLTFPISAA